MPASEPKREQSAAACPDRVDSPASGPEGRFAAFRGVTSYQWTVLLIASLGWIFDVFEGQIFVASMREAMPSLLRVGAEDPSVTAWNDRSFASFLLGGAFGGVLFGVISDRIGRTKTMIITILFYSVFTWVTAFAQAAWQMVVLRFFVAMGVGGEWAVASAMVAEVMPQRVRAVMSSMFHASSVFGTLLAAAVGAYVIGNPAWGELARGWGLEIGDEPWRWGFAIGVLPALLIVWVRWKLREPEAWVAASRSTKRDPTHRAGQLRDLFDREHLRNTAVGVCLAAIGLVTFWGVHIYGKDALLRHAQRRVLAAGGLTAAASPAEKNRVLSEHGTAIKRAEMLSMTLNTIGGGLGLVLFGTISNRLGRKGAFMLYHAAAFAMVILLYQVVIPSQAAAVWLALVLPLFGFFTLGMHAGYAVYFPELYPTRLRGTGAGFCFNFGRLATALALAAFGLYATAPERKAMILAPLYLLGIVVVVFARETRDHELPA
jgi:MFS family permease